MCSRPAPLRGKISGAAYLSDTLAYGWHDVTTNRTMALAGVDMLQGRFRADTFSGRSRAAIALRRPGSATRPTPRRRR
jgi:hypothetical protein